MASKCLIIFSLFVILSVSPAIAENSGSSPLLPCLQKILPCQPYLKAASDPPATCCIPLKDVVANDQKCLCDVFNNADLLRSFNITQDDALKLAKACQANADVSICKTLNANPPSGSSAASPPAKGPTEPHKKSAAHGVKAFGGFVALFLTSVILFAIN